MDSQGLFDAIMDGAALLDKAGRVVNWNSGAANLFGFSKKEVLGRSINLIFDRNYPFPKLIQELQSHQKKPWHETIVFIRKNGIKGHCKIGLTSLPPADHNKITALVTFHNVTAYMKAKDEAERTEKIHVQQIQNAAAGMLSTGLVLSEALSNLEQTEKKLRESELRFHLLASNATDIISRHLHDGTYLYVSPACKTGIGYNYDELINKNIYKLIHHDDLNKLKKAFTRRRQDTASNVIIYRIRRKEGEFRWFESNIRLILDEQTRQISEIQLASRDVTDRVLDKKARLRGQQLAHVFRLSTMEEMASGMAHEISQPLAAIVNYTRGCVRHMENSEHNHEQLQSIMQKAAIQAERAGEIVQRLKNFFCKGQLVKTSCKMNNIVRETVGLIKNELTLSKTKVDFDFHREIPFIFIDKIQIQQVLLNLMQNAIEAMQENHIKSKRICIQTKTLSDKVELTLTDTGPGFTKENTQKVFMPFFTTKAHGRGMGLAICRSIIEAHGGQFTINPNTNNNSWIRFTLPLSIS